MATIGNLFVSVGASTTGLNKGLDQASKRVSQFRNEVIGSLGKVPATGFLQSAFLEVETFFNKIKGDAEGAKRAMAEVGNLQKGLAQEIAKGHEKVTAAVEKSKVAQDAVAAATARQQYDVAKATIAQKYAVARATEKQQSDLAKASQFQKLKLSAEKASSKLESVRPQLEAAAASYKTAQANVGRATTEEAVAAAIDKESRALAKFNAMLMERNALENKRLKSVSGLDASRTGLQRSGISLDASGNPNMRKLNDTSSIDKLRDPSAINKLKDSSAIDKLKKQAEEAKNNVGVVSERALAQQKQYEERILATVGSMKSFAAMSVGSAAGLAVLGGGMIAVTGAAIGLTLSMARIADELNDQAQAMGLTAQSLQALRDTYLQLGVSSGAAEGQMQRLQISLQGGDDKTTGAAAAFKQLGLEMQDLREMQPDQALNKTIEAIRKLGSQSLRMKALRDVFGRGGTGMAAAVNATNHELKAAQERSDKLRIPDSMIKGLAATNDNVEMMHRGFTNMQMMFASSFTPAVDNMSKSMFELMTTDTESMNSGMQALAVICAVIFDVLALVVGLARMLWNLLQALFEILASGIVYVLTWILKAVEKLVYAFEFLTGKGHAISESIAEEAKVGFEFAKNLAVGAGEDMGEAIRAGIDSGRPDATFDVVAKIQKGASNQKQRDQSKGVVKDPQETAMATNREALLKKMTELETAARQVHMTPMEISLEEVRNLAQQAGENLEGMNEMAKRAAANIQTVAVGLMEDKIADGLKQAQEEMWLLQEGAAKFAYEQAMAAGSGETIAKQLMKSAEETENLKKQAAALSTKNNLMEQIAKEAATAGLSDKEKLAYQLKLNGADEKEIEAALLLKEIADDRTADSDALTSWKDLLGGMDEELLKLNTSREEQLRKMGKAAGIFGQDLDDAVANALKLEKTLTESQKLKAAQESSKSTLKDLEDEVRRLTVGDKAFKREQFAAGADDDQMARYDALTATAESMQGGEDQKQSEVSAIGTIETAFGSFNFGLDVQKQILTSAEQQAAALATIAANTAGLAGMKEGVASGATSTAVIAGTDPQLAEANKLLAMIETNTRGTLS